MSKFTTLLLRCFVSRLCFAQLPPTIDSSMPGTELPNKTTENNSARLKPDLIIYPNPANNKITLQVKYFDPGMVTVKVLDIRGKLVREDNRLLTNGTEDIIMFLMFKPGIYFIVVSEAGKIARKKLVIQ